MRFLSQNYLIRDCLTFTRQILQRGAEKACIKRKLTTLSGTEIKNGPKFKGLTDLSYWYRVAQGEFSSLEALSTESPLRLGGSGLMPAKDLIWGSLLGDGYSNPRGCITLRQSVNQTHYLYWKWEVLKNQGLLTKTSQPKLVVQWDKRTLKFYFSLRFNTLTLFKQERALFYPEKSALHAVSSRVKQVTQGSKPSKRFPVWESTRERWTAQSLAVWFMDDGGQGGHSRLGIVIDVSGWGYEGRLEAQRVLKLAYNLDSTFQGRKDNAAKLFIPEKSAIQFRDRVKPYIVPSQYYKIAHLF